MTRLNLFLSLGLIAVCVPCSFAQSPSVGQQADSVKFLGAVSNGTYRNEYFQFAMKVPAEFFRLTEGEITTSKNAGAKLVSEDVKGNRDAFEKAALQEVILLAITDKPHGSVDNSTLAVGAMRQPKGSTARGVVNVTRDFFLQNPSLW